MGTRDNFNALLSSIGVDNERSGFKLNAPNVTYTVRYQNVSKKKVAFSVEHKNRLMLEDDLLKLPANLVPHASAPDVPPLTEVVWEEGVKQKTAHYSFNEWLELMSLEMPGTWWYLGQPDEYEEAREKYQRLDPLVRILGAKR
jgi:hypothetical protein